MPYLIEGAIAILAVVLQVVLSNAISILGAVPDLGLIYLVWTVIRRGQLAGEIVGFCIGLLLDILSSGSLGSHSLSFAIVGFLLGYFYNEEETEQRIRNWPFLLFVAVGAFLNGIIYYMLFKLASGVGVVDYFLGQAGLAAIYTTIIAVIPMLWSSRRPLY
ncbi:MAG TPA: rod shape-determining protein MreD [Candidatus Kapabacteria bacterium]|nr:rod shape-determining protein MreD [Candidatus Kapabacteria bacterium]HYM34266.1 rod shape-determining protein MreD [Steroidobacteraceae bacterium]